MTETINRNDSFLNHEIRDRTETPTLGSWRISNKGDSHLWCRVTASDRMISVIGDFGPIVFAYGPRDPRHCIAWIGNHTKYLDYPIEKASIGMGGKEFTHFYSVEETKKSLTESLEYNIEEEGEDGGSYQKALKEGIDFIPDYDGLLGVNQIYEEVSSSSSRIDIMDIFGDDQSRIVRPHVLLAIAAICRLHTLLLKEEEKNRE